MGRLIQEVIINNGMDNYQKFYREQFKFSLLMAIIFGAVVFFLWLFGVIEF
jgi:ketopantoate reductase